LNIVLDLAFVNPMGVAGVALATVIAQLISAFLCLRKILSLKSVFRLQRSDLRPVKTQISRIIGLGIPSGLTQAIFSCAMMVVQRLINGFGDELFVACNVMVMRVDGYAMLPNFSFGQAMGTYAGQNIGARRLDRLKDGTKQGLIMSVCTALVLTPAVLLSGPMLMRLFTPEKALINLSMQMMYILAAGYIAMSVTQVLQGVMRGAGDTVTPMWIGLVTAVILRLPLAYALVDWAKKAGMSLLMQERMVFISLLINWLIGMIITIILYKIGKWKRKIPVYDDN
jgi:putative MATE family efflux protein